MAKEKGNKELIPEFVAGEHVILQRTVQGRNVIMFVTVREPCSLSPDRIVLTAEMISWGVSPHADGRVANQRAAIDRLLGHLQAHCTDLECPHRAPAKL